MLKRILFFIITIGVIFQVNSQPSAMLVRQLAEKDSLRLTKFFIDLHQHPELSLKETRTANIIANELKTLGYSVITQVGGTGVVAVYKNGAGSVVMYRADMDALPVKENTGLPYASTKIDVKDDGSTVCVMHACGHDAHITWLLGAAKEMIELKDFWKGTLVLVAQPAEEILKGANAMINDPKFKDAAPSADYLFGMHSWSYPVGYVDNGYGNRFAGTDQLDVTFHGISGHGARPEFSKDPIVMACNAVLQYQTIISRNIAAQDAAVLTIGSFQAGSSNNIIPPTSLLKINLRWFNDSTRNVLLRGIKQINEGIAVANNLPKELYPSMEMKSMVNPIVNNEQMTTRINKALKPLVGTKIITNSLATMGSEDFPLLISKGKKTNYAFMLVGIAPRKYETNGETIPGIHNDKYVVDLSALPFGTAVACTSLIELFKE
jgi:amidohydrolase